MNIVQATINNTHRPSKVLCRIRSLTGSPFRTLTIVALLSFWMMLRNMKPTYQMNTSVSSFRGPQYWKQGVTLDVKTLYETPFARFQIHRVHVGANAVVDDWLFFDEADHVNVLVQDADDNKFVVVKQTKYSIQGTSLAVVGGLIESGEEPLAAAKRELREEVGMMATDWISLGSFRVSANRGGGTVHLFWARKAKIDTIAQKGMQSQADLERQQIIRLSQNELMEAVLDGKFQEIKWTATIALALLREMKNLNK